MNSSLALTNGFGGSVPTLAGQFVETLCRIAGQFAFLGMPSKKSAKQLPVSTESIVRNVAVVFDNLLIDASAKKSSAEFDAFRKEVFPKYIGLMRAIAEFSRATINPAMMERLAVDSSLQTEKAFSDRGERFGLVTRDQALFTIWTFRKTNHLIGRILALKLPADLEEQDAEFGLRFEQNILWARFHLDCLIVGMSSERGFHQEVLDEIVEGLRAAVNAYSYVKQAVELRDPRKMPEVETLDLDAEEERLLNAGLNSAELASIE